MGSSYDQTQTQNLTSINEQIKASSKINKWILGVAIATLLLLVIQICMEDSKYLVQLIRNIK